ncbi:MAG: protein translocase subunit SecF, partial [Defluviitaleaceae bacterium]|nr:protein translocase subunit SecF [Defluviitaleaceae bacterium]
TGKSLRAAIEAGYKRAFPAILDSNVTSLIVSAILFWLGSGPVKGFAQTLFIGIIVSMFSALVMTKLITLKLVGSGITDPKLYTKQADVSKYLKNAPTFVEWRKYSYVFSGALIAIGAAFAITNAARGVGPFNLDVEFSGGTSFTIDMGGAFENDDVASLVREITGQSAPQIQKILNTNQVMIKIRSIDSETRISLIEAFVDRYDVARDDINYSDISATVSADMQRAAVIAMSVSFVCLLIYISWRFKDIRMGASTVFALMHDAALVIAAYAVLRIPLNYSFIAVMLAVIGYSINANIILFDRVRENRPIMRRETNNKLINTSVAQTLRRTLYSSVSTMLAIVCLYIIGVPSIKEFTLPLLIGLVVGAYSTVFLTGTFWCMLGKKRAA